MKRNVLCLRWVMIVALMCSTAIGAEAQTNSMFTMGKVSDIHPLLWLETLMQRQHDGLTGHPEALSYPYNSCLWAGEISRPDESYGDNWWRYEQTAYYTDGLLRLGYELNDDAMVAKAMEGIEYTLAHPSESGVLGNSTLVGITWPMSVFFRVLQAKYEHDGDERIPAALEKHYLNFEPTDLACGIVGGRNIMSIEGILWTYGKTGNPKLLQLAEEAWAIQHRFAVDETAILSDEPFYMHSVTFCEMLKLPLLLYAYTGNQHYLDLAMTAVRKVESESMLPDGVPSSAEFLLGDNVSISHETCDIVDFTWTLSHYLAVTGEAEWADKIEKAIYNAGLGCITKDFRSLQYFSSVNQFIATGTSNHNIYKHGSTWMAYRPTHETECCSGNVNRMLPNLVSRMWMTDSEGGAVAAIYGPNEATFQTDKGDLTLMCTTGYPFSGKIVFLAKGAEGASIPLTIRIPTWCTQASVSVNGSLLDLVLPAGTFVRLSEQVKPGDLIMLTLPMTVEKKVIEGQGIYFQRGPLLFSYPIPQQMTEDTTEYECMHGKKPENPDFKCWNITPTGDFNYAFASDGQSLEAQRQIYDGLTFPFDLSTPGLTLRIPVKQIEWDLVADRYTPAMPEQGHLTMKSDATQYITLVPYGCTELRLTVFPDADAQPMPEPVKPDYTRPADAPDCVQELVGVYYAYFEEPRFCWDEPIYCKVRTASDPTTDLNDFVGSEYQDMEIVGTTANGRYIWKWTGPAVSNPEPEKIIFTNKDLLTDILPFVNGGYYIHDRLLYVASQTTGIKSVLAAKDNGDVWYDLQGRRLASQPAKKGLYITSGKKMVIK